MRARASEILLGLLVAAVAAAWCWGVVATVPGGEDGARLGPRGFPLGLGVLLGILGGIVALQGMFPRGDERETDDAPPPGRSELWAVSSTVGLLAGYGALLHFTGFVIASAATVAVAVGPVLGNWRPRLVVLYSLGFSLGAYLVFGKLLGVYLPVGSLVNLAF